MIHPLARPALFHAALALAGLMIGAPAARAEPSAAPQIGQLIDSGAWVRFLGWSADGRRLAWRAGSAASSNVPGQPCLVARLDERGREVDRLRIDEEVTQALVSRRIHSVAPAARERVSRHDVLLRASNGQLWAALARDKLAALLAKVGGVYQPLWRWPLRASATALDVVAYESPQGQWLAVVLHAQQGRRSAAALLVVPTALDLPAAATASGTASASPRTDGATP